MEQVTDYRKVIENILVERKRNIFMAFTEAMNLDSVSNSEAIKGQGYIQSSHVFEGTFFTALLSVRVDTFNVRVFIKDEGGHVQFIFDYSVETKEDADNLPKVILNVYQYWIEGGASNHKIGEVINISCFK